MTTLIHLANHGICVRALFINYPTIKESTHSDIVKAYEFVKWMVQRAGGPLRVAKAMRAPSFQPTLHKICAGHVASPKRASAQRIAAHFGIPVDAVYDDSVATRLYERMCGDPAPTPARAPALPTAEVAGEAPQRGTRDVLQDLARLLAEVPTAPRRSAIAALLAGFAHEAGAPEYVEMLTIALQPHAKRGVERLSPDPRQGATEAGVTGSRKASSRVVPDSIKHLDHSNWRGSMPGAVPGHAP